MISEGDKAPAFSLESSDGGKVSLKDFSGKTVVLYFYPKDNTPGCTRESEGFRDAVPTLKKFGATVIGISRDSIASHCGFRDRYRLTFPLLSDPDSKVHQAFGAWGEKNNYGKKTLGVLRTTVIISPSGKVAQIFRNVKVDGHVDKVVAAVAALQKKGAEAEAL